MQKIINFIGEKIEEGKWESEKGVEEAIAEGEKEFGATLTEEQKAAGDVNGDNKVNAADAIKILRFDAGFISTLD